MSRSLSCFSACLSLSVLLSVSSLLAEEVKQVAGRSIHEYAEQLQSEDRVERLKAVRSLAPFGAEAADVLRQALDHGDAAVRFVAAEQLGRLAGDSLPAAVGRLCELAEDESSQAVRLAASFALCRHGLIEMHLPTLVEALDYPERGMACTAAYLIGEIGPEAEAAEVSLQRTFEKNRPGGREGDYHLGGASLNALRKIRDE